MVQENKNPGESEIKRILPSLDPSTTWPLDRCSTAWIVRSDVNVLEVCARLQDRQAENSLIGSGRPDRRRPLSRMGLSPLRGPCISNF